MIYNDNSMQYAGPSIHERVHFVVSLQREVIVDDVTFGGSPTMIGVYSARHNSSQGLEHDRNHQPTTGLGCKGLSSSHVKDGFTTTLMMRIGGSVYPRCWSFVGE